VGSQQFLYSAAAGPGGIRVSPWPVISGPWGETPTFHRYDQVAVFRHSGGTVSLLASWPSTRLPSLPPGASYAPAALLSDTPPPPSRRVLD
jgi:hypothetical protein